MTEGLPGKIASGLKIVEEWEYEDLLLACRKEIPFHEICPEQHFLSPTNGDNPREKHSPYAKPDDHKYNGGDLLLKRMTVYFQSIMTWVNDPECELCGHKDTKLRFIRGPLTAEEHEGEAGSVEVYFCPRCNAETTTFPRYNNPKKLLETKRGRCEEYANLFGLFCRSAGFETRYVMDFADNMWIEVCSNETSRWIIANGCEGTIDEPSMNEDGWGKKSCYNLAFTIDSVVLKEQSRQEIIMSCQGDEDSIRHLLQTLRIRVLFEKYMATGMSPNQAAAKAINEVASETNMLKE